MRTAPGTEDRSNLQSYLTASNASHWLQVTSKHDLDNAARQCIRKLVGEHYYMPLGLCSSIQPKHADQLLEELQTALNRAAIKLAPGKHCSNAHCSHYRQTGSMRLIPYPARFSSQRFECTACQSKAW